MCDKAHSYTVEVIGDPTRYSGTDEDEAVSALCGISEDEEGYVVAEHEDDGTVTSNGPGGAYCHAESVRLEIAAMLASA